MDSLGKLDTLFALFYLDQVFTFLLSLPDRLNLLSQPNFFLIVIFLEYYLSFSQQGSKSGAVYIYFERNIKSKVGFLLNKAIDSLFFITLLIYQISIFCKFINRLNLFHVQIQIQNLVYLKSAQQMKMERQPVISEKDSDQNQNQTLEYQNRMKKTFVSPQFVRSSQLLSLKLSAIVRSGFFKEFQTLSVFYTIVSGPNWKNVSGQTSGISQMSFSPDGQIIWNFPIEANFETDYLASSPQIVFIMYGHDFFGRTIPKAYGNIHFPLTEGSFIRKVRMFKINQFSIFTRAYSLLTGSYYEFKQIQNILNSSQQRTNLKAETCGTINIEFQTRRYNFQKYGYEN